MAILEILKAPNNVLNKKSIEVESINDELRSFMDDMLETMYHDGGVGIAAPQVGVSKRIFVLDLGSDDDMNRGKEFYPKFIINPKIEEKFGEIVKATEGCLSVPGQRVEVERMDGILIKYIDYHGKKCEIKTTGWLSRAIQHEIDHLDGKLLIDYLSPLKRNMVMNKLKKLH